MDWQQFEKLKYLARTQENSRTAVILFHGYGADATDLYSLGQVYKLKESCDWFFPQGVLEVPIGPMMSGRAWFPISQQDLEDMNQRQVRDEPFPPSVEELLQMVARFLNQMGKNYENLIIGGFSQGAILTSHCFYRVNFSPKALLLFSGFMVSPSSLPVLAEAHKVPFFQSHGQRDEVLPLAGARTLFENLQDKGLKGKWFEFSGGHEIPIATIAESQTFLNSVL